MNNVAKNLIWHSTDRDTMRYTNKGWLSWCTGYRLLCQHLYSALIFPLTNNVYEAFSSLLVYLVFGSQNNDM